MPRFATIDVGTNSVLLLVADRTLTARSGRPRARRDHPARPRRRQEPPPVARGHEGHARGARRPSPTRPASWAREGIAVSATSAARDAQNGAEFLAQPPRPAPASQWRSSPASWRRSSRSPRPTWTSAARRPGRCWSSTSAAAPPSSSTATAPGEVDFRHSFDVGSVRLTERFIRTDPVSAEDRERITAYLRRPSPRCRLRRPPPSSWAWPAR